jgi:[glutamine synthetase] adenylyltransferase / [glutamine synthetase]-adenylyl-L-tyrosine phosphorylase
LATRPYFARFTQALITALTVPMAQGRLYEVDMRLRPSGNQGPVATSWGSFTHYQQNDAWTWEHLALTRARPVAGNADLCADIETFRTNLLARPRDKAAVLKDVTDMRVRLAAAKSPTGLWDAKTGAGRMMDVELVAQAGALLSGSCKRDVAAGLQGAVACGWLVAAEAEELRSAYVLYWTVQTAARLLSSAALETENLGEGGGNFLCRSTEMDTLDAVQVALSKFYDRCAPLISSALEREVT